MTLLGPNYYTQMVVIGGNYRHYEMDFYYGAFI